MRVSTFLADRPVAFESLVHPPAFTAQKLAKFLHLPGREVAKCVLLAGPEGKFLAVLPATQHVDTGRLAEALGGPVRLAGDGDIAATFPDCEWGVVPPFGRLYGLPTMLEASIHGDSWMVFEADTHAQAIRMRCRDYERLEKPRRLAFAS